MYGNDPAMAPVLERWKRDPVLYVKQDLGAIPDRAQALALRMYARRDPLWRLAMLACVGVGKSTLLAWIVLHFMTFEGDEREHPQGMAMSKSRDNLKTGLWKEIALWLGRSHFTQSMLVINSERLYHPPKAKTWQFVARSFAKTASVDEMGAALSGQHARRFIVALDETGALHPAIGDRVEQAFSTADRIRHVLVSAGNPLSQFGLLWRQVRQQRRLHDVIEINGDPDSPTCSNRIDKDWARRMILERGGREAPWVMAHILGRFPKGAYNALMSPAEARAAMARQPMASFWQHAAVVLGIDVASDRATSDPCVIARRQGLMCFPFVTMQGPRPSELADSVMHEYRKHHAQMAFIDGTGGYGDALADLMRESNYVQRRIGFSDKASKPKSYYNKRAEMLWNVRQFACEQGGALPDDEELFEELTAVTYEFKGDRILFTDKIALGLPDQRSTNKLDATALTFAGHVQAGVQPGTLDQLRQVSARSGRNRKPSPYDILL